jgi:hypothetical protein
MAVMTLSASPCAEMSKFPPAHPGVMAVTLSMNHPEPTSPIPKLPVMRREWSLPQKLKGNDMNYELSNAELDLVSGGDIRKELEVLQGAESDLERRP